MTVYFESIIKSTRDAWGTEDELSKTEREGFIYSDLEVLDWDVNAF